MSQEIGSDTGPPHIFYWNSPKRCPQHTSINSVIDDELFYLFIYLFIFFIAQVIAHVLISYVQMLFPSFLVWIGQIL